MKDKSNLWSLAIMSLSACIIFCLCAFAWDLFHQTDPLGILKVAADCCTVPAVLFIGISILGWIGSKGMFDIFGYSIGGLFRLFSKDAYEKRSATFYDYRVKKDASRKPFNWPLLAVGLAFFTLAIGLTVAFLLLE